MLSTYRPGTSVMTIGHLRGTKTINRTGETIVAKPERCLTPVKRPRFLINSYLNWISVSDPPCLGRGTGIAPNLRRKWKSAGAREQECQVHEENRQYRSTGHRLFLQLAHRTARVRFRCLCRTRIASVAILARLRSHPEAVFTPFLREISLCPWAKFSHSVPCPLPLKLL